MLRYDGVLAADCEYDLGVRTHKTAVIGLGLLGLGLASLGFLGACQPHKAPGHVDASSSEPALPAPATAVRPELPDHGIGGVVITEDGAPILDAQVCAWPKRPPVETVRDEMLSPICADTNPEGGYALELEPRVWHVVASAREREPEHLNVVLTGVGPQQAVDLMMEPGGRLRHGRVLDLLGQPVAGARVRANLYVGIRDQGFIQTATAADGSFELWATHYAHLRIRADGYAHDFFIPDGDDHTLVPESVIRGRVVDQAGAPAPGVRVAARGQYSLYGDPEDATRTDERGEFELTGTLPGTQQIIALADDAHGHGLVELDYGQAGDDLVIRLEPWPRLQLRVVEPGVGPVALCGVDVARADDPDDYGERFWTDEEGRIDVPLQPNRYRLKGMRCLGKVRALPVPELELNVPLELEVTPGRTVRGRAFASSGQPLAQEELWLRSPSSSEGRDPVFGFIDVGRTQTDAEGHFVFGGVVPGRYTLNGDAWVTFDEMPSVVVTDAPTTEVSVTLPPSGRLVVQLSESQWDQMARVAQCKPSRTRWNAHKRSDGRGRAVFEHIPVGEHVVRVEKMPYCSNESLTRLKVNDGDVLSVEVEVEPPKTSTIVVHVEDPGGAPVRGALVQLNGADSSSIVAGDWSDVSRGDCAVTGEAGVARIVTEASTSLMSVEALAPGLSATLDGYGTEGYDHPEDDEDDEGYEDCECDECEGYETPELEGTTFTLRMKPDSATGK